jgi:hypothetical protein
MIERKKMEYVIKQLKQFKTDAIYEKKKHYNAADRKRRCYKWVSITQIVLNAITGTTLFTVVFGDGSKVSEILALIFTIAATILASVQKIGDFENQAQGNAKVADMYLRISKKINLILNFIKDGALTNQEIVEKAEEIRSEISQANEIGTQFPTNQKDYNKAQEGIKNGEENYTDEELELWE